MMAVVAAFVETSNPWMYLLKKREFLEGILIIVLGNIEIQTMNFRMISQDTDLFSIPNLYVLDLRGSI